jgi:hypothetical protein
MHDHDDDDLFIWILLAPEYRGWTGFFLLLAWIALGLWIFGFFG